KGFYPRGRAGRDGPDWPSSALTVRFLSARPCRPRLLLYNALMMRAKYLQLSGMNHSGSANCPLTNPRSQKTLKIILLKICEPTKKKQNA
ncbi:hypothetical protein, partial [Billgrantia gudaonensis]|uniref:hypothetical protein n=1 Tax=Billgrantia gudaonensis TaxID=376427 RepID=UPI001C409E4E